MKMIVWVIESVKNRKHKYKYNKENKFIHILPDAVEMLQIFNICLAIYTKARIPRLRTSRIQNGFVVLYFAFVWQICIEILFNKIKLRNNFVLSNKKWMNEKR